MSIAIFLHSIMGLTLTIKIRNSKTEKNKHSKEPEFVQVTKSIKEKKEDNVAYTINIFGIF